VFERAALMVPPEIAGFRLQAFSLWHSWVLYGIRSPYRLGGEPTIEDTALALLVCSADMATTGAVLNRWLKSRIFRARVYARLMTSRHATLSAKLDRHIESYMASPHTLRRISGGQSGTMRQCGSPPEWNAARVLMCDFGLSEAAAWNMSYCRAACYKAVHDEACDGPTVGWREDCSVGRPELSGEAHPVIQHMFGIKPATEATACQP
jgi:hypothetical protein